MHKNSIVLSRRHKFLLHGILSLVFFSGVAWAWFHYFSRRTGEFGDEANPAEPWMLKLHGAAAMVALVILGTLFPLHVKSAWHADRNRINGAGLLGFFAVLSITGYGLYYIGGEQLRAWTSWMHLGMGFALPAMVILHIKLGKVSTRNAGASRRRDRDPAKKMAHPD